MSNKELMKGMIGLTVVTSLGSAAMQGVANIGHGMSAGMRGATNVLIGGGIAGHAMKLFKWK